MTTSGAQQGIRPGVCLSTSRPASPYIGQIIYMTDINLSAVWDGTYWVGLDRSRDRNVVINGSMQIAQRTTSSAGITATGYFALDRYQMAGVFGTHTMSQDSDAPTGSGFRNSLKLLCTTANASPTAGQVILLTQYIEGRNVQHFAKGTSSAKQFTLSFWVKSNVTGTYVAELEDSDNARSVSASYSITLPATWERKVITFPADTTGAFNNDNGASLSLFWWLASGTNFTSGTLQTSWASMVSANRAVGQTNYAAATNNYWQVTGVQLEAGPVVTPFEFEDYAETFRKCQRYYNKSYADATVVPTSSQTAGLQFSPSYTAASQGHTIAHITFPVAMRANPIVTVYSYANSTPSAVSNVQGSDLAANSGIAQFITTKSANIYNNSGGTITPNLGGYLFHYVASAEL